MGSWVNWAFHLGFYDRVGPIISLASIYDVDKDKYRSVLYKGYLSEPYAPYMDVSDEWYYRTFFDAGEHGLGQRGVPLEPTHDCPSNAVFIDGYVAGQSGNSIKLSNIFCVFEPSAGDIMWRHIETEIPGEEVGLSFINRNSLLMQLYNRGLFVWNRIQRKWID